jgi:MFS transporter, SP family, general alpha glucoside:H+ symporter
MADLEAMKGGTLDAHLEAVTSPSEKHVHVINQNAQEATLIEHTLTLREAFRKYPKAIFWSVMVSTSIIMEGYDIVLVTSLFAQPAFLKRYGHQLPNGTYQVPGPWQSALSCAATVGAIFGAFGNGYFTHHFGYRKVLLVSLVAITGFIFVLFFATSLGMLEAGLVLCGIPWGVFATLAPAYASEVCPLALRGYLTVYVNLCWAFGQLIAAGVLRGFVNGTTQWAYRIPFAIQWVWPVPLFIILWFAPESPWWLVRRNRTEDAIKSIRRLSQATEETAVRTVALIVHTNKIEDEAQTGTSYWDCFRGVDLRRTEIVCMTFAAQIWCGSSLGGTPAYFFVQAGLNPSVSFDFSVGGLGLASIGTIVSWFLLGHIGRRTLYVWGLGILAGLLLIVGIVASASDSSTSSFVQAGLVLAWLWTYYLTVGPVCYAIISEIPSSHLRNKSICLSRISYYISQVIGNVIYPYMVNPTEGNLKGKAGYIWAGTCVVFFVWAFFRLPETKDRTFEEIDILFLEKVKSRHFRKYHVDAYANEGESRLKAL